MSSTWRVEVGGSLNTFDTTAGWSPKGLAGAVILLEDTLGLETYNKTLFVRAGYRLNRRHSFELSIADLKRTATKQIDGDIEWGDYVFRASGKVSSRLDTRIYKLKWKYDFSDSDRLDAGFSVGLSTYEIGLTLSGEARLESDTGSDWVQGVVEGADVVAPVPVIGFFLDYGLSPKAVLRFSTDAIDFNVANNRGRVLETRLSFEYGFNDLIGVGAGVSGIDLRYRGKEKNEQFGVNYRINSIDLYLSLAF